MDVEEEEQRAVRIFVGGLGEAVTGEDLRRLFGSLGTVQSLETIRTKGRSLAYLDFLPSPSDPKSLTKLFSKYNGCAWKGGRLRLEKARENYLARLKKEWEEDAALVNNNESPDDDVPAPNNGLEETPNARRASNIPDTKQLRVFFPRLRKVKSIPFSGSGKHKYSFQNIKVPPMPVHFCDCEEHCSPFVKERLKVPSHGAAETGGINEEEINIMNAVMNKLLEKEKVSNTKHLGKGQDSFEPPDALPFNEREVDSTTDDDDDDDLIINIETKKNKAASFGRHELERIMENPESWSNKTRIAKEEPKESMLQVQKRSNDNDNKVKKRKSPPEFESESNRFASTAPGGKSNMQALPGKLGSAAQPDKLEFDFGQSSKVSWTQKSSWRELLGHGGSAAFSTSLILPKLDSGKDQQISDDPSTPSSATKKTENIKRDRYSRNKSTNTQVIQDPGEAQPTNTQVIQEPAEAQPTNKRVIKESTEGVIKESAEAQPTDKGGINGSAEVQPTDKGGINGSAEVQPTHKQVTDELAETQHNVAPNNMGRGASWLRKQSWTQLVSQSNNSFSISQILPDITFPEPIFKESVVGPTNSDDCKHGGVDMDTTNEAVSDGFKGEIIPEKSQHAGATHTAAPVAEEKTETSPGDTSTADIEIGETCSFMRSAASLKEWAKAKAALSGSLKRKRGEK